MSADAKADTLHHVEKPAEMLQPLPVPGEKILVQNAEDSVAFEHSLSPLEAIKSYPMAIFWCLVISTCVIMEGYSQILVQSLYAYPQFQLKYGENVGIGPTGYQISAPWQAGLTNASGVGAFFGTLANGYLVDKFGHKRVLLASLVMFSGCVFITFFSPNATVLLVGQLLSGLPWGVFATAAPAYASECLPMVLRVYFTSFTNMCFIIGQLIAAGVLRGLQSRSDEWAFRIPFAIQWIWPCFLIPLIMFAPPSPWHEVRMGNHEKAEKSLRRLQRSSVDIDPKKTLAQIVYTNNLEEELSVGTSYWDCFKGFELRRTEIACICFMGQPLTGEAFAYNSSYFFERVGLATEITYSLNLGGVGLALLGTLVNWFFIMPFFGRRTAYIAGAATMASILIVIGILNTWVNRREIGLTQSALCLLWTFVFQLSVGQLGWAMPAEVSSTRLRQKTICLARNAYYITSVVASVFQSYYMNPTAWNLAGYTGFCWAGPAIVLTVWAFFRLPETKARTYEELDMLFAKNVPARKFKSTDPDVFGHGAHQDL